MRTPHVSVHLFQELGLGLGGGERLMPGPAAAGDGESFPKKGSTIKGSRRAAFVRILPLKGFLGFRV